MMPHPQLACYQNAWMALRMIRDEIEELGPAGAIPSPEAVLMLYGPEPAHEAEALIESILRLSLGRASSGLGNQTGKLKLSL